MLYFVLQTFDDISAPKLVNALMNSPKSNQLSITHLVAAGELFGIEPTAMRMAVTRLMKEELIVSTQRGVYKTGPNAAALKSEIRRNLNCGKKTRPWQGQWLVAYTAHLGRSNKTRLRARARAFAMYGFTESNNGLWLRPANLNLSLFNLKKTLVEIGIESDTVIVEANKVLAHDAAQWRKLWSAKQLQKSYKAAISTMTKSTARLASLTLDNAARECLLVGQSVMRTINLDPLLPAELVNVDLFETMVSDMKTYDAIGNSYWRQFFSLLDEK